MDNSISAELIGEMSRWRQHLHQHPEFGFEEVQTAAFISEKLHSFGFTEIASGVGGTGVVATLRSGQSNRAIGFRADMDALRITETGTPPYASQNPGVMHACGHDGHVAMLLGAAKALKENDDFDGVIHFIFQPAEEWGKGMSAMLDDGLLDRFGMEEAYGIHNMPGIPVGHYATRSGAFMAAEDNFAITITGSGGHASRPHDSNDALLAACATVTALQNIVSRHIDPSQLAVVSVTELLTDGTRNAIAGSATILGDTRSYDASVSQKIEAAMRRIANGVAQANDCNATIDYTREFVPLSNDPKLTQYAATAASNISQHVDAHTPRIGASEDFARLTTHIPGNFMFIGNGDSAVLHNAAYDFNDAALPYGAGYFVELAKTRLSKSAP